MKQVETSKEAFLALRPEHLRKMYVRIVEALKVLGTAHYEDLSDYLQCQDRNQISRRLKEMEEMELIWKPGGKKLTKRNRNAFVYQLRGDNQPKVKIQTFEPTSDFLKVSAQDLQTKLFA